jgi:DNA repair exonuclease SbcCD ATPase subunit
MGRDSRTARTARVLNEAHETLGAWALRLAAANKRMAELERELNSARELLSRRENEVHSLEKSLGLRAGENLRLSDRLSRIVAAAEVAADQLEQARTSQKAAEAERDQANGKHSEEIAALNAQLEAASTRATRAEQLFADAQQNLLASTFESSVAKRRLAGVETTLHEKERQVEALKLAQLNLLAGIKSRDTALALAEERIRALAELFLQLEAKAAQLERGNETGNGEPPVSAKSVPGAANAIATAVRSSCAILRRDLESDAWLFSGRDGPPLS